MIIGMYCLKKSPKCLGTRGASSEHITKLEQSIFFRYLCFGYVHCWVDFCTKIFNGNGLLPRLWPYLRTIMVDVYEKIILKMSRVYLSWQEITNIFFNILKLRIKYYYFYIQTPILFMIMSKKLSCMCAF
jgi:hypothetical protein